MSKVKRFDVPSMRSLIHGEQAVMGYEAVLASDYDALAAEAQALREEVAALRARVAVVPDPVTMDGTTTIREYVANAVPKDTPMDKWTQGYEECKRRIHAMFEQPCNKRPNGLTVSEGLLRRLCEPLLSHADYVVARNELRALLSEQDGGKT
ncbi:hypothetical protein N1H70_000042 [Pseudomonas aeruginosa]|nr:hypothetical protein [Pseudomonas aeruginosa]